MSPLPVPQEAEAASAAADPADGTVRCRVAVAGLARCLEGGTERRDAGVVGVEASERGGPDHVAHGHAQSEVIAGAVFDHDLAAAGARQAGYPSPDLMFARTAHMLYYGHDAV